MTALILTTTFTNTGVTVAQSSFSAANAKALLGSVMKCSEKHLVLDGVAFAQLAPSDKNAFDLGQKGAYGYNGIHCQTEWTGATTNVYGFAAGPEALAMYANIPLIDPGVAARLDGLALGLERKDASAALLAAGESIGGLLGSVAALVAVQPGYETAVSAAPPRAMPVAPRDAYFGPGPGLCPLPAPVLGRSALPGAGRTAPLIYTLWL